jgi:hypothetical protein
MLRAAEPSRPLLEPAMIGGPHGEAFVDLPG